MTDVDDQEGLEDERAGAAPGDGPDERDRETPDSEPPEQRRRRLERVLPQVLKRAIERGLETGLESLGTSSEALRGIVGDNVKLPKEIVGYIFSQVDETKNAMVRVVAHEIRDFLSATDLASELHKALTSLSFEIRTEIRFVPNDAGGVKPEVKAEIDPRVGRKGKKKQPDAGEDET